jgi:4-amino-4-deoxy-L-arabinose transferase-like glycosyltransferase
MGQPRTLMLWLAGRVLWFGPLESPHLFEPDEGRYAEIPREMVASGDWVTPRLDAIKYFEKPPLQYWATAVAFRALWRARLDRTAVAGAVRISGTAADAVTRAPALR